MDKFPVYALDFFNLINEKMKYLPLSTPSYRKPEM